MIKPTMESLKRAFGSGQEESKESESSLPKVGLPVFIFSVNVCCVLPQVNFKSLSWKHRLIGFFVCAGIAAGCAILVSDSLYEPTRTALHWGLNVTILRCHMTMLY